MSLVALADDGCVRLTIDGRPSTKKTSQRVVPFKGRHIIIPSKLTAGWSQDAERQLREQSRGLSTIDVPGKRKDKRTGLVVRFVRHVLFDAPVNCRALVYRDRAIGDAVNFYQAIADVLEHADVVTNDRLIESWDGSRMFVDRHCPRVEIELTPLDGDHHAPRH